MNVSATIKTTEKATIVVEREIGEGWAVVRITTSGGDTVTLSLNNVEAARVIRGLEP